jgi:hypothetical protein
MDDSDEDVPIAELLRRKQREVMEKAKQQARATTTGSQSQSDKKRGPTNSSAASRPSKKPKKKAACDDEDNDDDDDDGDDDDAAKGSDDEPSSRRSSTQNGVSSGSNRSSGDDYYSCKKGKLIQSLLVRWWYAMEWPRKEDLEAAPPAGYEAMEGFPGVFVSTRQDTLGAIEDRRSKEHCPCLSNLRKRPAAAIKELCVAGTVRYLQLRTCNR